LENVFPIWCQSFFLAIIVETPIFVIGSIGATSLFRGGAAGIVGTTVTHPILWFVWPFVIRDYFAYVVTGEILVVLIEAVIFFVLARPVSFKRAAITSVAANSASFLIGVLIG